MVEVFTKSFYSLCDKLAQKDEDIKGIIIKYGYPPLWYREPTFETLIHFILEQQVSLASAKAALLKLKSICGKVTPQKLMALTDDDLRACYFSRQKTMYARHLAHAIITKELVLKTLCVQENEVVKEQLTRIKGIGNWTADVFLMMSLHRSNCFPCGDVALIKSTKHVKNMSAQASKDDILAVAENWQPYRTIAAFLLWHAYLERRKRN